MTSRILVDLSSLDTPEKRQAYIIDEFNFILNLYESHESAYIAACAIARAFSALNIISFDEDRKLDDIFSQKRKEGKAAALSA